MIAWIAVGLVAFVIALVVALPICRRLKQRRLDLEAQQPMNVIRACDQKRAVFERGKRLAIRESRCIPAVQAAKRRPPHSQLNVGVEQLPRGNG